MAPPPSCGWSPSPRAALAGRIIKSKKPRRTTIRRGFFVPAATSAAFLMHGVLGAIGGGLQILAGAAHRVARGHGQASRDQRQRHYLANHLFLPTRLPAGKRQQPDSSLNDKGPAEPNRRGPGRPKKANVSLALAVVDRILGAIGDRLDVF